MITVLLVDDQATVRQGLRMRLGMESDLAILGEASDGHTALVMAQRLSPDVVVMDVKMPGTDGLAATEALCAYCPQVAVVVLSLYADAATRQRAKAAGAVAFVEKPASGSALVAAIRQAAARH